MKVRIDATSAACGFAVGAALGGLLGYLLRADKYRRDLDKEVAAAKAHYEAKLEADRASAARTVPGHFGAKPSLADLRSGAEGVFPELSFGEVDGDSDYDYEITGHDDAGLDDEDDFVVPELVADWPPADRDRSKPYVISRAEFVDGADEQTGVFRQITITWYAGDNVLVDELEAPIRDARRVAGPITRAHFGGPSEDASIMYVRNEALDVDYEIKFDERSYVDAVLNYGQVRKT
jgi:hypothetical protein